MNTATHPKHKYSVNQQVFYRHETEEIAQLRPYMYGEFWYMLKSGREVCETMLKGSTVADVMPVNEKVN